MFGQFGVQQKPDVKAFLPSVPFLGHDMEKAAPPERQGGFSRKPARWLACPGWRSAQEGQDLLGQLVGLGDHRCAGLLQDLRARQVGGFRGEVCVHDPAAGSGLVFDVGLQVRDHGLEAVLRGTEGGTLVVDGVQGLVDDVDGVVDLRGRGDVGGCAGCAAADGDAVGAVPVGGDGGQQVGVSGGSGRVDHGGGAGGAATQHGAVDVDAVGGVGAGTHLEGQGGGGAGGEQGGAVELGALDRAVDFLLQLLEFLLQVGAVAVAVGGVTRLDSQFTHALQVVQTRN